MEFFPRRLIPTDAAQFHVIGMAYCPTLQDDGGIAGYDDLKLTT